MPADNLSKPPAEWLEHLHEAGHWQRLIEMASRSLSVDPNDADTHRHLSWAYAKTDQTAKMKPHVEFLLHAEPNEERNHHLAAVYHLNSKRHKSAKPHIDFLLQHHPNGATYHYLACIYALRRNKIREARSHISEARALAPEWPAAAHLEIAIDGTTQRAASDAWDRIRRLKEALALDPRNAGMLTSIGTILLTELEQPREAEDFFRQALAVDPSEKDLQRNLLETIRARSLLYRTLSLPITAVRRLKAWQGNSTRLIFLIVALKAIIAFLAWLIVTGLLFVPAAKIYEWLVLVEVTRSRGLPKYAAPLAAILHWPLWLRLALALSIIVSGWILLFYIVFTVPPKITLEVMAVVFGVHLVFMGVIVGLRILRASVGLWWNRRRQSRRQGHAALGTEAA